MKTAIVTGATGFIGIHLVEELISKEVGVTAVCRSGSPNIGRLPPGTQIVYGLDALPNADVFYHLAWESVTNPGRADAAVQARNATLTINALNVAKKHSSRFIGLGTVYEKFAPHVKTARKFNNSDFYILSKDYAHTMADQLAQKLEIDFIWCTICHPVGRLLKQEQMMGYVISNLINGKDPAFGPAQTPYDIVAVEDVARGLSMLGSSGDLTKREYYIGSGTPRMLYEWLEETASILSTGAAAAFGQQPDDGFRFERSWFDITDLANDTGYKPSVSFEQAVNNAAATFPSSVCRNKCTQKTANQ